MNYNLKHIFMSIFIDLMDIVKSIDPPANPEAKHFLRSRKFLVHVHSSSETWILVLLSDLLSETR